MPPPRSVRAWTIPGRRAPPSLKMTKSRPSSVATRLKKRGVCAMRAGARRAPKADRPRGSRAPARIEQKPRFLGRGAMHEASPGGLCNPGETPGEPERRESPAVPKSIPKSCSDLPHGEPFPCKPDAPAASKLVSSCVIVNGFHGRACKCLAVLGFGGLRVRASTIRQPRARLGGLICRDHTAASTIGLPRQCGPDGEATMRHARPACGEWRRPSLPPRAGRPAREPGAPSRASAPLGGAPPPNLFASCVPFRTWAHRARKP
jgi:hypothetical protein